LDVLAQGAEPAMHDSLAYMIGAAVLAGGSLKGLDLLFGRFANGRANGKYVSQAVCEARFKSLAESIDQLRQEVKELRREVMEWLVRQNQPRKS